MNLKTLLCLVSLLLFLAQYALSAEYYTLTESQYNQLTTDLKTISNSKANMQALLTVQEKTLLKLQADKTNLRKLLEEQEKNYKAMLTQSEEALTICNASLKKSNNAKSIYRTTTFATVILAIAAVILIK